LKIRLLILLFISLVAGELKAARSSSRNLKALTDNEVEEKKEDTQDIDLADGGHIQRTVVRITFLGPKTGWGFVTRDCPYYSMDGKNMGSLKAGALFKYNDVRPSSKNDMLVSIIRKKGGWTEPCLLPCDCIAAYDGDPEKVDIQIVGDLREYFLTKGQLENRKEELLQNEYQKNPFYGSYQQASKNYNESVETARQMELEANKLTGIRKTRADEELREFKYKQAQLQVRLNEVALKYREWKDKNPVDLSRIRDPQLDEIKKALQSAKSKVADLVPDDEN